MKVLVCGDRSWSDRDTVHQRLAQLPPGTVVIHGDCKGADKIAGTVAEELGLAVIAVPAKWGQYGKVGPGDPAGPIRNKAMLDLNPDLVIAFHADLSRSKGTKGMKALAEKAGVPVEVIRGE